MEKGPRPLSRAERYAFAGYRLWTSIQGTRFTVRDRLDEDYRRWDKISTQAIEENQQNSIYLPEMGLQRYRNHPLFIEGAENIPQQGPLIIVMNHYNQGPDTGIWTDSVVPSILADHISDGWNVNYRFTVKNRYEIPPESSAGRLLKPFPKLTTSIEKHASHILANFTEAGSGIKTETKDTLLEIRTALTSGDVIIIYPSGKDEYKLSKGLPGVGAALRMYSRTYGAQVLPVGTFDQDQKLFVNFGHPIRAAQLKGLRGQEAADLAMEDIARLLPNQMRGVYGQEKSPKAILDNTRR